MSTAHSENFTKILTATAHAKSLPHRGQIERLQKTIVPAIASQAEKSKGKIKRLYETAHNACTSLAEGLKSNDATRDDYADVLRELADLADQAKIIEAQPAKAERKPELAVDSDAWLDNQALLAKKMLLSYKKYESQVPRSLTKKFLARRLPIIPLTSGFFSQDTLNKFKMMDNVFFGYPILRNQVMLGLNNNWYKHSDIEETLKDILTIIRDQTGKRYIALSAPKQRGQVLWVWLADEPTITRLNKAAIGGHFSVKGWAFPFEADELMRSSNQRQGGLK